ncbi:hypothetical protein GCM10022206_70680 [Streptomyces chiangmaiensis]
MLIFTRRSRAWPGALGAASEVGACDDAAEIAARLQSLSMTPIDTMFELAVRRRGRGFHFHYFGGSGWVVGLLCLIVVVALATWWQIARRKGQ